METITVNGQTLTPEQTAALAGFISGFGILASVIVLVMVVLLIIAHWRLFTKAGEKGWKSLIPIYSDYVLYKLVWDVKPFWIFFGASLLGSILTSFGPRYALVNNQLVMTSEGNQLLATIGGVITLVSVVVSVIVTVKTAYAYGKGTGFAVGMVLLHNIFVLILAYGSSQYVGPNGVPVGARQGRFEDPRAPRGDDRPTL